MKTDILNITRPCDKCSYEVRIFRKHCDRCGYLINASGLYHLLENSKDENGFELEGYDCELPSEPPPF